MDKYEHGKAWYPCSQTSVFSVGPWWEKNVFVFWNTRTLGTSKRCIYSSACACVSASGHRYCITPLTLHRRSRRSTVRDILWGSATGVLILRAACQVACARVSKDVSDPSPRSYNKRLDWDSSALLLSPASPGSYILEQGPWTYNGLEFHGWNFLSGNLGFSQKNPKRCYFLLFRLVRWLVVIRYIFSTCMSIQKKSRHPLRNTSDSFE